MGRTASSDRRIAIADDARKTKNGGGGMDGIAEVERSTISAEDMRQAAIRATAWMEFTFEMPRNQQSDVLCAIGAKPYDSATLLVGLSDSGLSIREIASRTGTSAGYVGNALTHAKALQRRH